MALSRSRTVPPPAAPGRPYRPHPALSARVALCGALTAVAVCAAPAYAHPPGHPSDRSPGRTGADHEPVTMSGTIEMTPVTSHPGAQVQLRLAGCGGDRATATSEAFVSDARLRGDSAGLFARATVRSTVAPGTYAVRIDCVGHDAAAEGRLTIVDANEPLPDPPGARTVSTGAGAGAVAGAASGAPSGDRAGRAQHPDGPAHPARGEQGDSADRRTSHDSPVGAVTAGGGGTSLASDEPGTPGLVLAGTTALIAAGLIWHRRRNDAAARRRTEDDQ